MTKTIKVNEALEFLKQARQIEDTNEEISIHSISNLNIQVKKATIERLFRIFLKYPQDATVKFKLKPVSNHLEVIIVQYKASGDFILDTFLVMQKAEEKVTTETLLSFLKDDLGSKKILENRLVTILKNSNCHNHLKIWNEIENLYEIDPDLSPVEIFFKYCDISLLV